MAAESPTAQASKGDAASVSAAVPSRERNFSMGLLVHLLLVVPWVAAPPALFGSLIAVGLPHGLMGVSATLGLGAAIIAASSNAQKVPLCLAVCGIGAAAPAPRHYRATMMALVVSFLTWMCKGGKKDSQPWPALREFVTKWAQDFYTRADLRGEVSSMQKDKSCFAFHPHGCLSAGFTINGCYNPAFHQKSGKITWLADYNLRYKNPFFKIVCEWLMAPGVSSVDSADKKTFQRYMAKGENVALIPGGFQDAVAFQFGKEVAVIKRRKGFIKYCLQYGYRVHPVYTFGESETYHTFTGLQSLRMRISEHNIPMVAFWGMLLLPFLPKPESKIITYVGPPLELPHVPNPASEDVDKWHGEYVKALTNLFNEKRAEAGYPDAELHIM
eukprot:TRINITY_DN34468_c0_g1_i1.p1 TRINITY_DN34468_c0_g1~~TRINITY_DN34468_c0_g1_i1.p1  ORF type:complete len:413 (-),score=60.19 TRINITY_DN34468_c0_g1_i1:59-1216(-)